jgi:hypothetical protein
MVARKHFSVSQNDQDVGTVKIAGWMYSGFILHMPGTDRGL